MDDDMEVDGLTAGRSVPGPKGVGGGLLADLERRALEEQRQLELAEAARKDKGKAKETSSNEDGGTTGTAVGGTYVPGAGAAKKARVSPPTSAAGAGESASTSTAAATTNNADKEDSSVPAPPPPAAKKARVQPTIRMVLTFPGYPPNKDPQAKHVPIFDIHDTALKHGLLLPPEEAAVDDEASSSGASDDEAEENEKGEDSNGNAEADETAAEKEPEVTDSQRAMQAALDLARKGKKPVIKKKRVLDRDEGYDVEDPFVDDSEMLVDEPKFQPTPKMDGYIAIVGIVETVEDDSSKTKQRGRKFGSVNKPKVTMVQADGTTKLVSEAVAAKEAKRNAKLAAAAGNEDKKPASASESPALQQAAMASTSSAPPSTSTITSNAKQSSSRSNSIQVPSNPKGPLMSKDAVMYSHLPSSTMKAATSPPPESSPPPPPRSKSISQTPSNIGNGWRMSPINLDDDAAGQDGDTEMHDVTGGEHSRIMSSTPAPKPTNVFAFNPSPEKGARKYEYDAVSTPVEAALTKLRKVVAKESFIPKSKFPPYIKPMLVEVAILAMKHGEYDDNFFNIMPNIFPYNRFTMVKLIKREVCEPRCKMLEEEISQSIQELSAEANKTLPTLKAEYDAKVKVWEKEMAEWQAINNSKGKSSSGGNGDKGQQGQRAHSLTPVGSDGDTSAAPAATQGEGPEKPKPKFKFNDSARMHLWRIMTMSAEITDRKTEKAEVEQQEPPSAMNATKARYQELTKIWPEGWVTSNQLSREMTAAKKKLEKTINAGNR